MRILIHDQLLYSDGCRGRTWVEYPDSVAVSTSIDATRLELHYNPITVQGCKLIEEKTLIDGQIEVIQEFALAPDIAYALFRHWESCQ